MKPRLLLPLVLAVAVCSPSPSFAAPKDPPKKKTNAPAARVVDSGSFGIFVNGRRVATETFRIEQQALMSVARASIQMEDGSGKQESEMQIQPNGSLVRYTWRESLPIEVESVIEANDQFLIQRFTPTGDPSKAKSTTHLLSPSTAILDDNFFSHRQLLAWRYLGGSGCGAGQCKLDKVQFGVLIPHQQSSATVFIEFVGKERMARNGVEQDVTRFNLTSEGQEWSLWLNEEHKLVRILIASENTEVLRD